ncbi:MAG: recombination protein RecR [Deltaproteobacteria bacterium]|nr:recombination protein RecR [Deltaproteobacteria bacterium]
MSDPVTRLILEFSKLPGIGEKTAMRLAYHVFKCADSDVRALSDALIAAKTRIRLCERCFTFTEASLCAICANSQRRSELICVVEKPADVLAVENSQKYQGHYHVLHGVLSPLDGVGPEQLRIRELIARIGRKDGSAPVSEIILAINPTVEGEATVVYLSRLLTPLGVRVSKIAHGIPVGGVLEYMDRQTIGRAIENRVASLDR